MFSKESHTGTFMHTKKLINGTTKFIEPFYSTEWKLSKQEKKGVLSNSLEFLENRGFFNRSH